MAFSSLCILFLASVIAISFVQGKDEPKYIAATDTCLGSLYEMKNIYVQKSVSYSPVPSIGNKYLDLEPTVTFKKKEVGCGEEIDPNLFCNHPTIHLPQASVDYLKKLTNANGAYRKHGRFPYFAVAIWAIGLKLKTLPSILPATLSPEVTKTLKNLNSSIDKLPPITYLYELVYNIPRDILGDKKAGFNGKTGDVKFPYEKPLELLDFKPVLSDFKYIIQVHAQSEKYDDIKAPEQRLLFKQEKIQEDLFFPVGAKFVTTHYKIFSNLLCLSLTGLLKGDLPKVDPSKVEIPKLG